MIILISANTFDYLSTPDAYMENCFATLPETNQSEESLFHWAKLVVEQQNENPERDFRIFTFSSLLHLSFRVLIKENALSKDLFKVIWYDVGGEKTEVVYDSDGRSNVHPKYMFDMTTSLLRRLL